MNTPRPYTPSMPATWWLRNANYLRYMLREVTSFWIGAYVVVLVAGLFRLQQGPAAWQSYLDVLGSPPGIAFQVVALLFALYHSISWFALAPSTMPIWYGETQVPAGWIKAGHYIVWFAISIFIFWLAGV